VSHTLLSAAGYIKDNRLLPVGFDKSAASQEIAVYGAALEDETFVGGSDTVVYEINVAGAEGPFTVSAELLYDSLSTAFVRDMAADETEESARFVRMYEEISRAPVVLAKAEKTIE
jgi:hypothetical protein